MSVSERREGRNWEPLGDRSKRGYHEKKERNGGQWQESKEEERQTEGRAEAGKGLGGGRRRRQHLTRRILESRRLMLSLYCSSFSQDGKLLPWWSTNFSQQSLNSEMREGDQVRPQGQGNR